MDRTLFYIELCFEFLKMVNSVYEGICECYFDRYFIVWCVCVYERERKRLPHFPGKLSKYTLAERKTKVKDQFTWSFIIRYGLDDLEKNMLIRKAVSLGCVEPAGGCRPSMACGAVGHW